MKTKHAIFSLAAVMIIMLQTGCGSSGNATPSGKSEETMTIPVEAAEVTRGEIAAYYTGTATLEAENETEVVAKVSGVVESILTEEGKTVKAGQSMARLEDEKLRVKVDQAQAGLKKLETELKRSEELFSQQLISTEEYQGVQSDYNIQKATYDLASLDLEYATIKSPIDGVVSQRHIKVGNMVQANEPVFRVTSVNPLLAILHVPEGQMSKLKQGHPARLQADALESQTFQGRILRISPVVDPASGTIKVTVLVSDPSGALKPGMFARVHIVHDVRENVLLVPKDAIISEDKTSRVFIVQDSMALRKEVKIGYVNTTHIEVLSGLDVGDRVVTTGKSTLKDSTLIELVGIR